MKPSICSRRAASTLPAVVLTALMLGACSRDPAATLAAPTIPTRADGVPATAGASDPSLPDAGTVLAPSPAPPPKTGTATTRTNDTMSRNQEAAAMPLPGQNNDHSAPLPPAPGASAP